MSRFRSINTSRLALRLAMGLLFCFLLLLNCITPYIADDYCYMVSFYDHDWITSIWDIFPSMYVHCLEMNGRVVPHTLEQLFFLVPSWVFDLCNALAFTGLIYLLYRIANVDKSRNLVLFLACFAGFWYFLPVFGQVCLWQVGALNYLWGLLAGLGFLLPYLTQYLHHTSSLGHRWQQVLFFVFSFLVGLYTEITSLIVLLLAVALLLLGAAQRRTSCKTWLWLPIAVAGVGYLLLLKMPAETAAKQVEWTLENLMANFISAATLLRTTLLPLWLVWVILLTTALCGGISRERLTLSLLFSVGSLTATGMLTAASYLPERCLCTSALLLVLSSAILLADLGTHPAAPLVSGSVYGLLAVVFAFSLVIGTYDIWQTYTGFTAREQVIAQCIANGETDLVLQCIHPATKYSGYWGILDLDTETSHTWPNNFIASYYGVSSILGY